MEIHSGLAICIYSTGKHSASFPTPRTGIGNLAEAGRGGSVSDFGNTLDTLRGTTC
jgi:hypothetical protein